MDLAILYYTANRIDDGFAMNIRYELEKSIEPQRFNAGIISISQKPILFGSNICVGDIGASVYNVYRQILIGARAAATKWVACCEDDTLYPAEHFEWRPPDEETFCYNMNRWWIEQEGIFRYRDRTGMCTCICSRDLLVEALEERFEKFPKPMTERRQYNGWGEPGRYDGNLGLTQRKLIYFKTEDPIVTFNHKPSLGGLRRTNPGDIIQENLEPWGNAKEVWKSIHG